MTTRFIVGQRVVIAYPTDPVHRGLHGTIETITPDGAYAIRFDQHHSGIFRQEELAPVSEGVVVG